ncbi:MAG: TrkH family potassium uptake protein [Bacteroidales bacterium]|nr:TrkH family potassium uptake protein [Bacteroidales bacterium]MCF8327019.1 TrkH family potassium uptake protein [Bacteroidales bacterium]
MARWNKLNIRVIRRVLGSLVMIEGAFMLTALGFSWYYGSDDFNALLYSAVITILAGFVIRLFTRPKVQEGIGKREGYVIVSFTWVIISLFGALPFILSGAIPSYTNAFFETISGFTTTGASILTDIESMPEGLLFWRSLTHWIGGMGIIVLSLAILPILGIGGMQLFIAEVPGPTPDKLHPRVAGTAKRLWGIYLLLTVLQTGLLMFGGMDFFNSLCHTFGTVATGGFSTQNTSIAEFSPYIQYVIIIFMVLAGTNFALHFMVLSGRFKDIFKNEEYRYYLKLLFAASIIVAVLLILNTETSNEKAIRDSLFQVVSITTTTGYVTTNYMAWPSFIWIFLFILMFTGGSAGSTGGGLKAVRQLMILKSTAVEFRRLLHPRAFIPVRLNDKAVPRDIVSNIFAFFILYMLIFGFGTLIMVLIGLDFDTSIGSVIATLGNIGPAIGNVGPVDNYAAVPDIGKWFLSFLMLIGRLELFTVLILFSPKFWSE